MRSHDAQVELEISVKGMACEGCVATVTKAARTVAGVTEAHADLGTASVRVRGSSAVDRRQVVEAIRATGYEAS